MALVLLYMCVNALLYERAVLLEALYRLVELVSRGSESYCRVSLSGQCVSAS